jgi:hypothetical protein
MHKWMQLIREDPETPEAVRERIDMLTAVAGETDKG